MKILGIESSCDETAAAVVENGSKVLSSVVASSEKLHAKTGGIIPENAARRQLELIVPVINKAMKLAHQTPTTIDAIAVTVGPGLIGSLLVGVETAKTLARLWNKPIIPVNHLVGHIYATWLQTKKPRFPALALVVSGGHTDLVLVQGHGKIKWLGGTRDDAAGEAFDKTARLLGIGYPGGPAIAVQAALYVKRNPDVKFNLFPRPMMSDKNYDWSFSGLKTAFLKEVQNKELSAGQRTKLAAEVQEAIVEVLVKKTLRAVKEHNPKSLLLSGGVAANTRLREKFSDEIKANGLAISFHVPEPKLCTDNAAYIAAAAYYLKDSQETDDVFANPQLTISD